MTIEITEKPGPGDELDFCVLIDGKPIALFRDLESAKLFASQYSKDVWHKLATYCRQFFS